MRWSQFHHHQTQLKVSIHDRDLTMWAMDKTFEVDFSNFKASLHCILDFENEYKITSPRIMHLVTKRSLFLEISLQPIIDEFRENLKWLISAIAKRTLDIRGSKQLILLL